MKDLEDAVFNDEARKISREMYKRVFVKRCSNAGFPCFAGTEYCGTSNTGDVCACNTSTDGCYCTYDGAYDQDYGGTIEQKKAYE
ncbi:unnamed protein product [Adineta steineri]|uniref:Uncharacterized protein n=1 Tax=Adineta steineri TaxID=433720 RepID=A0A815UIX4_9BILA|nr:unnamed protein product [Adineta steineri]CAF4150293.1 unnamed protein product [Adineta steineri]